MPKLTVAIVGAGLSGLTLGLALRKFAPDVHFEIYEGASQLSEVGAGVSMRRRHWAVMQALGLDSVLLPIAGGGGEHTVSLAFRKSDQAEGLGFDDLKMTDSSFTFHRAELQKALLDQLQTSHTVHLRKRFESFVQPKDGAGPIGLLFHDGTTATCDVLVGADGVRSAVRGAMYARLADAALAAGKADEAAQLRTRIPAVFSGFVAYRTLIHMESLSEGDAKHPALSRQDMMVFCGKNRQLVTYPISQGRVLNVAAIASSPEQEGTVYEGPWTSSVTTEEITGRFSGWEPDVQEIVKHVQGALKWVINVTNNLPTFVDGRMALLGDAAHAMTPTLGAGAGQCFEDAYLLSQFLSRPDITKDNASTALRVYDEIRRPFAQKVAALSLLSGRVTQFNTAEYAGLTEEQSAMGRALTLEQLRKMVDVVRECGSWQFGSTVAEELDPALRRLDEALVQSY